MISCRTSSSFTAFHQKKIRRVLSFLDLENITCKGILTPVILFLFSFDLLSESRPPNVVAEKKRVHEGVAGMEMNYENIESIHIFRSDGVHGNPESVSLPVQEEVSTLYLMMVN